MSLRKCKECTAEISTKAAACPKCGAPPQKSRRTLLIVVAVIGMLTLLGRVIGSPTTASTAKASTNIAASSGKAERAKEDLEVVRSEWAYGPGNSLIRGTIRNNTHKQYKYAQVEINLYDPAGAQVGSTLANVNNLEPGGIWELRRS